MEKIRFAARQFYDEIENRLICNNQKKDTQLMSNEQIEMRRKNLTALLIRIGKIIQLTEKI